MAREKIKIKNIDKMTAGQLTHSKRRRGLIKKVQELSIPSDANASLIILWDTGKLYDFFSSSNRQMKEEYLEGLNMEELGQLEKKLKAGLSLVIKTEEERALNEINKLQGKETGLIKENKQLKREMKIILHRGKSVTTNSELVDHVSISSSSISPLDDGSSNTSN